MYLFIITLLIGKVLKFKNNVHMHLEYSMEFRRPKHFINKLEIKVILSKTYSNVRITKYL